MSWPAIFAGASVAAAVSLILVALGAGLGFASVSPWPGHGVSAAAFAVTTAIWLIVTQWVSSGVGGYMAGRLRTRWVGTHTHEVFFRDTAHGLVTWAVATLLVAVTLTSTVFSALGEGAHAASGVASAAAGATSASGPGAMRALSALPGTYDLDKLFRTSGSATGNPAPDSRAEVSHIIANAAGAGSLSDTDRAYLAELVAARTGIPRSDAATRVDEFVTATRDAEGKVKAAADAARQAASQAAMFTALSLLVGAFIASVSAVLGGRLRDLHP
ncbi:MAG TPA: hypothetical protein VN692_22170 [Steroidobacteraceae bacterium]|nr:hypothetical protein [Steroidobacteraceae bacterium]